MSDYNIKYVLSAIDQLTPVLRRAQAQFKSMDKMLKQLGKPVKIKIDTTQAQAQLKKLKMPNLKTGAGKVAAVSSRAGGIGLGQIATGATAYAGITSALDLASAQTELAKASNLSGQGLEDLKKVAIDLESATGQSAAGVMAMMTNASKAGVEAKDLANDVLFTSKVAVAFGMTSEEAATSVSELRSSFFSGQDYATQQAGLKSLAEMISYVADNSASSEPYLANFLQRSSGLEKTLKVTKESLAAAGATFEAIGIPAEVASRAINSAGSSMASLTKDNKTLAMLGLDPAAFRASVNKDVVGAMFDVVKASEKLDSVGQQLVLKDIFGEGFADELTRMGGAVAIYGDNLALAGDKAKQSAAFEAAYKLQMEGLNASVNRATNGFKTMLGMAVAPYLQAAADAAAPLIEWMKEHPKVVAFAAGLVALAVGAALAGFVFSVLSAGIGGLLPIATTAIGVFAGMQKGLALFSLSSMIAGGGIKGFSTALLGALNPVGIFRNAMMMLNAAFIANPIGVVVMAIAAFVALIALAWDHSSVLRESISKLAEPFVMLGNALGFSADFGNSFDYAMVAVGATISAILIPITGLIENIKMLGSAWDSIKAGNYGDAAKTMLSAASGGGYRKEISRVSAGAVRDWQAVGRKDSDANEMARLSARSPYATQQPQISAVQKQAGLATTGEGVQAALVAMQAAQTQAQSSTTDAASAAQTVEAVINMMGAATTQKDASSQMSGIISQFANAVNTFAATASRPLTVNVAGGLGDQGR